MNGIELKKFFANIDSVKTFLNKLKNNSLKVIYTSPLFGASKSFLISELNKVKQTANRSSAGC